MIDALGPIRSYRRLWFPELITLAILACLTIILFIVTDLDIVSARWFYHPEAGDPWPVASEPIWYLFYQSAPWITGSLALAGTASLIAGLAWPVALRFRIHGLFILLCVVLGPGLIVNGILKDYWGRPRPRQIVEFGGRHHYQQPLVPSAAHGKSFPCGHCSVGYLYGIGWWVWRRKHPTAATLSLAAGLLLGTLLGFGRMAAGGHFLSDNLWSGLIALGVAHALYYYVLRIPAREDSQSGLYPLIEGSRRMRLATISGAAVLGTGIILGGIVASPHYADLSHIAVMSAYSERPEVLVIDVDTLDIHLVLTEDNPGEIISSGSLHGFGLPTNAITSHWDLVVEPAPALRWRVSQKGWFPDLDGAATVRVDPHSFKKITIRVQRGDILVDADQVQDRIDALPQLEMRTARGQIQRYPPVR